MQVANGFDVAFEFQLTDFGGLGRGADGLAFVIQNDGPRALAGIGSSGGFALGDGQGDPDRPGIPHSIAVFFDTFKNGEIRDPNDNFIVIGSNGSLGRQKWPPSRLGIERKLPIKLKDGRPHSARIVFRPPLLSVYLDNREPAILSVPVDLRIATDDNGFAWVGFTASTGGGYENHDILKWSLQPDVSSNIFHVESTISFLSSPCLPGRNLCTPEEPMVEPAESGQWHIVLPAHLDWGVSIPNPSGRPVEILNRRGAVCGPPGENGATTCDAAIAQRHRGGRTEFTAEISARPAPRASQGYFEFDARLK